MKLILVNDQGGHRSRYTPFVFDPKPQTRSHTPAMPAPSKAKAKTASRKAKTAPAPAAGLAPAPGEHPAFAAARAHALAVAGGVKVTVAGCVALGLELLRLQADLGYVHGGTRRGDWPRPALPWRELVAQETGFSYDRCRQFMQTAQAVRQALLATRGNRPLKAIVAAPPAAWTQVDYCAFADAIGEHFEAQTFRELMGDLGLLRLGGGDDQSDAAGGEGQGGGDPYTALQAAHDCVAGPIIGLHRTMAAPEQFTRHLYELPLADQPGDRAAGIPPITGLMTLQTVLTQAQAQIAKAIADKRKGGAR